MIRDFRRATIALFVASALFFASAATLYVLSGGSLRSLVAIQPPSEGRLALGVDYRFSVSCENVFELANHVWDFDGPVEWPAAQGFWIFEQVGMPYSVRGVIRLTSATTGVFAPDNAHEMPIHYVHDGHPGSACL